MISCGTRGAGRGGFTLLEMLLAVAILSALTLLVALAWTQASAWTDDQSRHAEVMRLQRVAALVRDQWNDRRSAAALDEEGARVAYSPTRLSFVTATPILYPSWPIVEATYEVVRALDVPADEGARYNLVYREARVADLGEAVAEGGRDAVREHVLLEHCGWVEIRRYNPPRPRAEADEGDGEEFGSIAEEPSGWVEVDPEAEPAAPGEEAPALRIDGSYEGAAFSWVLVVRALR